MSAHWSVLGFALCASSRAISTWRPSYYTLGAVLGVVGGFWLITRRIERIGETSIFANFLTNVVFWFLDWKYAAVYAAFGASCGVAAVYYMMFDVNFVTSPIPTIVMWSIRQIGIVLMMIGDVNISAALGVFGIAYVAYEWWTRERDDPDSDYEETAEERKARLRYLKEGRDNARKALRSLARHPEFVEWASSKASESDNE